MARLVALLRGVNVGGQRKVPMSELRALAADLGLQDVATHIQSGNLVFAADEGPAAAAARLEAALEGHFGFQIAVLARTGAEWARHAAGNPFPDASAKEPHRVMLVVSRKPPRAEAVAELSARARDGERIESGGGALWVHYPKGAGASRLGTALIDRLLGSTATARNWTTVLALQSMLERGPA